LLDPEVLFHRFPAMGAGASLRGVEAVVAGRMEIRADDLLLRISGTGEVVRLAALTEKVQRNPRTSKPERATLAERRAYQHLRSKAGGDAGDVQITGPLRKAGADGLLTLEVRQFEFQREEAAAAKDKL
jgi:hypothetical protein